MTTRTYRNPGQCTGRVTRARVVDFGSCPAVFAPWSPISSARHGDQARSAPTPRCPIRSPWLQERTTRPSGQPGGLSVCPAKFDRTGPGTNRKTISPKRNDEKGSDRRCSPSSHSKTDRDHPRTGVAGPGALQRRHGVDDGAVLLRAARRHRRGQGVLPGVPGQGGLPRGALTRREPWGVWGGELFVNGKIVAQKRKRGRPPKVRPEEEQQAQSA